METKFTVCIMLVLLCLAYALLWTTDNGNTTYRYPRQSNNTQRASANVSNHARKWFSRHISSQRLSPHNSTNRLLCNFHLGRLGNKMFQFAAVYSLSKFYRRQLVIDSEMAGELETLFTLKLDNKSAPYVIGPCKGMKKYKNRSPGFHPEFLKINHTEDFELDGFFESWKYFYHDIHEINSLFTFHENYKSKAADIINQHCPLNTTIIGVHVRRGPDIRAQQPEAPWLYFQHAMQYYRRRFDRLHFIVVSSDPKWCLGRFKGTPNVTIVSGSPYEDMAVLASCDHSIMSIGTYSWWSAMLAQGTVLYYSNIEKEPFPPQDFFPPHWIPVTV